MLSDIMVMLQLAFFFFCKMKHLKFSGLKQQSCNSAVWVRLSLVVLLVSPELIKEVASQLVAQMELDNVEWPYHLGSH